MDFSLHTYSYYRVVKNPFGEVDTLFQILVWWVTMSDRPFSVSGHHPLYSKMLRECPSIFSAECDATLHDSCLDRTFFVSSVQKQVLERWHHFLFSRNGASDIHSNVHLPIRQNPNLSTTVKKPSAKSWYCHLAGCGGLWKLRQLWKQPEIRSIFTISKKDGTNLLSLSCVSTKTNSPPVKSTP